MQIFVAEINGRGLGGQLSRCGLRLRANDISWTANQAIIRQKNPISQSPAHRVEPKTLVLYRKPVPDCFR